MLDALADWIDDDRLRAPERRGGRVVRRAVARRRVANAPLVRTAEIASLRGAAPETVGGALSTSVGGATAGTSLNINTGVRRRRHGGRSRTSPARSSRRSSPSARASRSRPMAELRERMPRGVLFPEGASFAFASSYFLVTVRSRQGESVAQARALLKRDGRTWPTVVWQVLE
jgi:hypothetical protein